MKIETMAAAVNHLQKMIDAAAQSAQMVRLLAPAKADQLENDVEAAKLFLVRLRAELAGEYSAKPEQGSTQPKAPDVATLMEVVTAAVPLMEALGKLGGKK